MKGNLISSMSSGIHLPIALVIRLYIIMSQICHYFDYLYDTTRHFPGCTEGVNQNVVDVMMKGTNSDSFQMQ